MIIPYQDFIHKLNEKIKDDENFLYELLITVIKNPARYTGIFRLSNARTKLIQNVTQSKEIKFGDFMEDIVTDYIEKMGYQNINKNIGTDLEKNALSADQVFSDKFGNIYLIEQKIRDDHDSTKKRGQYANFKKKFELLIRKYPEKNIIASMWFIDPSLTKNKKYYLEEAQNDIQKGIKINIYYGEELFSKLFNRLDIWMELNSHLETNKRERSQAVISIPDFDTSEEIHQALKRLKTEEKNLYKKLVSDKPEYVQLRNELFPTGINLEKL